jgi:hypothetical protein
MDDPGGYDCIAEHFVAYNNLQAGVSFTGNTRSGWFYLGDPYSLSCQLDEYWWRGLFDHNKYHLGETLAYTKDNCPTYDEYWQYCQWTLNLQGDPAMPLWTDTPMSFDVTHPTSISTGTTVFPVHVEEAGGGSVADAYVCIWKNDEVYLTGFTDGSGDITMTPSPVTEGAMYVTVTKQDFLPYEGLTDVTDENAPPNIPSRPTGRVFGSPGKTYTYSTSTTDPNGDDVYYMWDWGDGTFSDWLGPYASGAPASATHSWFLRGTYMIRVKAKDVHGEESDWSNTLAVRIQLSPMARVAVPL